VLSVRPPFYADHCLTEPLTTESPPTESAATRRSRFFCYHNFCRVTGGATRSAHNGCCAAAPGTTIQRMRVPPTATGTIPTTGTTTGVFVLSVRPTYRAHINHPSAGLQRELNNFPPFSAVRSGSRKARIPVTISSNSVGTCFCPKRFWKAIHCPAFSPVNASPKAVMTSGWAVPRLSKVRRIASDSSAPSNSTLQLHKFYFIKTYHPKKYGMKCGFQHFYGIHW
jgi:hypothetical protein